MNDLEKGRQTNEPVAPNDENFPHCSRHPVLTNLLFVVESRDGDKVQYRTDVISNGSQNDAG